MFIICIFFKNQVNLIKLKIEYKKINYGKATKNNSILQFTRYTIYKNIINILNIF